MPPLSVIRKKWETLGQEIVTKWCLRPLVMDELIIVTDSDNYRLPCISKDSAVGWGNSQ